MRAQGLFFSRIDPIHRRGTGPSPLDRGVAELDGEVAGAGIAASAGADMEHGKELHDKIRECVRV